MSRLNPDPACLIVIDGLCAAELHRPDHGHSLAAFLAAHLPSFPEWLKLVCTVRSQDAGTVARTLPFQRISLDKTDVDERLNKDTADYITARLAKSPQIRANITPRVVSTRMMMKITAAGQQHQQQSETPQSRFTQHLTRAARGCFLFIKMTLDLLERGHLVIKSSSGFNVLPTTLAQIYLLEFNLRFPSERSFEKVRAILSVALAALTPLTPAELLASVNALSKQPELMWGEFLMRFSSLSGFLLRRADDTVMFGHPTLREWLIRRGDFESTKFLCDPRQVPI